MRVQVPPPALFPMISLLAALALLPSFAQAQPRCPGGKPAVFTGRPFQPFDCPRSTATATAPRTPIPEEVLRRRNASRTSTTTATGISTVPVTASSTATVVEFSSTSMPATKGVSAGLDDLKGSWEAAVLSGADRFLVSVTVEKGYSIRFQQRNIATMVGHVFEAELKGGFFGPKGRYAATVKVDGLPEEHEATVFAGAPFTPDKEGYDRELVLVYAGRDDAHRLRYKAAKDAVRFRYDYSPGGASVTGELKRAAAKR